MFKLLNQREAADFLGISPRTMESWRVRGFGPAFVRVGGCARYRTDVLEAWIDSRSARSTADPDPDGGAR